LQGDTVSAFGSVISMNRPLDTATAEAMAAPGNFIEAIVAPSVEPAALKILTEKPKWGKNLRILETGPFSQWPAQAVEFRGVRGGLLCQTRDSELMSPEGMKVVCGELSDAQKRDLTFAWKICKHTKSNAIVLAKDEMLLGVGAGQMSRVDSSWIAARKAGDRAKGSVCASDAFFPFPDALEVAINAGATAAIQPGGSMRDAEVLELAKKRGVAMVLTGRRHFKH
jgi:phosphoribosylaminoimidazolecarboxamide formyltransferase/IMP cyclohydrolase